MQAEDRLRQLAGKMAKVQRWRASQEVWTAHMRDRASDGTPLSAPTSPSQPAAAPPAPASPPRPAFMGFFRAPRISEVDVSMLPESRGSKRDALARTPPSAPAPERPPPAESRKKTRGTGALQAALAAAAPPAAAPQPLTASSALRFDSIDGSMRQFDAGVPRPNTFYFGCGTSARPG